LYNKYKLEKVEVLSRVKSNEDLILAYENTKGIPDLNPLKISIKKFYESIEAIKILVERLIQYQEKIFNQVCNMEHVEKVDIESLLSSTFQRISNKQFSFQNEIQRIKTLLTNSEENKVDNNQLNLIISEFEKELQISHKFSMKYSNVIDSILLGFVEKSFQERDSLLEIYTHNQEKRYHFEQVYLEIETIIAEIKTICELERNIPEILQSLETILNLPDNPSSVKFEIKKYYNQENFFIIKSNLQKRLDEIKLVKHRLKQLTDPLSILGFNLIAFRLVVYDNYIDALKKLEDKFIFCLTIHHAIEEILALEKEFSILIDGRVESSNMPNEDSIHFLKQLQEIKFLSDAKKLSQEDLANIGVKFTQKVSTYLKSCFSIREKLQFWHKDVKLRHFLNPVLEYFIERVNKEIKIFDDWNNKITKIMHSSEDNVDKLRKSNIENYTSKYREFISTLSQSKVYTAIEMYKELLDQIIQQRSSCRNDITELMSRKVLPQDKQYQVLTSVIESLETIDIFLSLVEDCINTNINVHKKMEYFSSIGERITEKQDEIKTILTAEYDSLSKTIEKISLKMNSRKNSTEEESIIFWFFSQFDATRNIYQTVLTLLNCVDLSRNLSSAVFDEETYEKSFILISDLSKHFRQEVLKDYLNSWIVTLKHLLLNKE